MLAPRKLPSEYKIWNRKWNAPYGRDLRGRKYLEKILSKAILAKLLGRFSIQPNNDTRAFEYPWAIEAGNLSRGLLAVDLGGGLAGFQFVLDSMGDEVLNVDPGAEAKGVGWHCDNKSLEELNRVFGTNVELINTTLPETNIEPNSIDRVFSISVIEHFRKRDFDETIEAVIRVLKPGGLFILTVDLFLDLHPFTKRLTNEWGQNFEIGNLLKHSAFKPIIGDPAELFGSESFDSEKIQSNLSRYLVGGFYPVLVQCLVLEKI